ncbi:uncharacterized protein E5676_scaffold1032G00100 [Cucumis melo var. makuwa]|uniref:Retrotransposon gag domain-containing protein n=1 Tax=Cucumis melo var. makuwa TaxID=1194695 RepID=A0A5A7SPN4_CUCMM|nr:uncharacterized protein E6C27_scaffold269G002960 [Cucumis melo var. makuwa]TYK17082.1 uncharacterized protein E5676_scaffold1032G00100 [Cucumis melo var. makuwa]
MLMQCFKFQALRSSRGKVIGLARSRSIRFLESRLEEIVEKTDTIDVVAGCVNGLPIQELLARVDTLEGNVGRTINYEYGDMRAIANQAPAEGAIPISRVKILEPKPFCGARDARALENYIFDLEQYFKATNTVTEEAKVTLTMMHLSKNAKLWWRSRYVDSQEGRCTIDTWDALKKELCTQFFPENVEILARRKLHELKHTDSIREYVKQFTGLMLDIHDISEKDKVFCFVKGLKPWAKTKLYEQRVQDLTSAYAAAERLFDLISDSQDARRHQSSSPGKNRNSHPSSLKAFGGDKRFGKDIRPYQSNTEITWRRPNNRSPPKCPLICFICEGATSSKRMFE